MPLALEALAAVGNPDADPRARLADGRAMDSYRAMISAQGGDPDAPLPQPAERHVVTAPAGGTLTRLDAYALGVAAWRLGAGRARKEDPVSAAAGVVWTAGVAANSVAKQTDFPVEERGRIEVTATLQVKDGQGGVLEGAWGCGDVCAVPDLTGSGLPDGTCVPNAQHALRQAKRLAKNLWAPRWTEPPTWRAVPWRGCPAGGPGSSPQSNPAG